MLPFTTSLLRLSFLAPLEIARAYAEAFLPTASISTPRLPAPKADRVPSDQPTNSAKTMSTQFYDTQVATVDYQILFTKRNLEAILHSGTVIVTSAMAGSGFASWQISLFILKLNAGIPKPEDWTHAEAVELACEVHPATVTSPPPPCSPCADTIAETIRGLKREYLKYLQVEYQIVSTFDRKPPRYDADQVDALREIANVIKSKR
jgi:hypothetical protein